jgi:hypothetical protein
MVSKKAVLFPFGWIRGVEDDNWQLLWNPVTRVFFAKGAISRKVVDLGESSTWIDAKSLADKILKEPKIYNEIIK